MTRKHVIGLGVVGAVVAAGLIVLHTFLPTDASWSVNRILHYAWLAAVVLAAGGAVVWLMWPRPKAARRDIGREQARRRVIALIVVPVVALGLVIFGEMRRDLATRAQLREAASPPLQHIFQAVAQYKADHGSAVPPTIEALAPRYLEAEALHYAFHGGPARAAAEIGASDPVSFGLAREYPTTADRGPPPTPYVAYLRPGQAWASLTIAVDSAGVCQVIAEDTASDFEWQFDKK